MKHAFYLLLLIGFAACAPKVEQTRVAHILNLFEEHPDSILVVAHRGGHELAPENSIASIDEAIAKGAHILELDVRQTLDGELVMIHDRTLDRTTTGQGAVDSLTWAELRELKLLHKGDTTDYHLITLKEALLRAKDQILVDLDYKVGTHEAAKRVYELVEELGMEEQVLFFLYDYTEMPTLHALNPNIRIMPRARTSEDLNNIIKLGLTDIIHIDESFSGHPALDSLRKKNIRIWANTLGKRDSAARVNPGNYSEFFAHLPQVNIVQTDEPTLLKSYLSGAQTDKTVATVMDGLVTRALGSWTKEQLDVINDSTILSLLTAEEKSVLSTKYWEFEVDQPVRVSVMTSQRQTTPPFWLTERGFQKTDLTFTNEITTYTVWQKVFPAGKISLGINGFDKHRPVYFVSLKGLTPGKKLEITPIHPAKQHLQTLAVGSFTYHDWDGLKLEEVPEEMVGETLLSTIRGRAREAHLIQAFRTTAYPSSEKSDQIVLTFTDENASQISVQWRTSPEANYGEVIYWEESSRDTLVAPAKMEVLEDRLLLNDRYVHRHSATLKRLNPGKRYAYYVRTQHNHGEGPGNFVVSPIYTFRTPEKPDKTASFEFIWFGDTHNDQGWGETIAFAQQNHPNTQFYIHSGDLVNTGLHRDDWDLFYQYAHDSFSRAPLMAVPGNHDSQDGLGASLFQQMLSYPHNGPAGLSPGLTYTFRFENTQFFMMDAASFSVEAQREWLDKQLSQSTAVWKILVVHFPPHNEVEPYPELVEIWGPLLEKYKVDFVFSGHFHYYLRTQPLKGGEIHPSGVRYMMSVGTSAFREAEHPLPFVAKRYEEGNLYQHVVIKDQELSFTTYDKKGTVIDTFTLKK